MRPLAFAAVALLAAAPLAAQQTPAARGDADRPAAGGTLPAGWQMRLDRANADPAGLRFVAMGPGYHVTTGPAAILWMPADSVSGAFEVRATITQTKAPAHPEAYGVFLGASELDGPGQNYFYFLVRGDGKYTVKHRAGDEVHTIQDWTAHDAVAKQGADGKATNAVAVRVTPGHVSYVVNGREVYAMHGGHVQTVRGLAGLRVNHNLDVHVDGFAVVRGAR